jgi:hypothetical protein
MRLLLGALLCTSLCIPSLAQHTPKAEIFGGFSYLNYEARHTMPTGIVIAGICLSLPCAGPNISSVETIPRMGLYGWNGAVTGNFTRWFGLTLDFSGAYSNASKQDTTVVTITNAGLLSNSVTTVTQPVTISEPKIHYFLFGPQFSFSAGKARVFGRSLIGASYRSTTESTTYADPFSASPTTSSNSAYLFAYGFGGGVNYPLRKKISWRIAADYLTGTETAQHHLRVSTGPVWRLGN